VNDITTELAWRIAWIEAYLAHYEAADRGTVFEALGVDPLAYESLLEELRLRLDAERAAGKLELSNRFASEVMRARRVLVTLDRSLEQVAATIAARDRDALALPDVVLSRGDS